MKKLLAVIAALSLWAGPSLAQSTKAQINTEITTNFPDNTSGQITPLGLRTVTADIVNSIMPTAPVVSGNLACFSGTTGLLQDCGIAPSVLIPGTTQVNPPTNNGLLYVSSSKLQNLATAANGVLVTSAGGVPSISSSLPSGLTIPSPAISTAAMSGTTTLSGAALDTLIVGNTATANALTVNSQGDIGVGTLLTPDSSHHLSFEIQRNQNTDAAFTLRNRNDGSSARSVLHFFTGASDQMDASLDVLSVAGGSAVNWRCGTATTGGCNFIQAANGPVNFYSNNVQRMSLAGANSTVTLGAATDPGIFAFAGTTSGTTSIKSAAVASGSLTLPSATDTLVGKATTDIFTNKTFDSAGTGNSLQISSVAVSRGQYPGEASTGNATAGNIGEYIESAIASGGAISLVSATAKNVTSISLTAGDWDVDATIHFLTAAGTSVSVTAGSLSSTANTMDFTPGKFTFSTFAAVVPGALSGLTQLIVPYRLSLSGTTTVNLVATSTFTVSTNTAYGLLRARRVR